MELKTAIEIFYNKRNDIKNRISDEGLSEAFRPIAEKILSGYFKVTNNRSSSFVTVHPTCVEIYYHEEGLGNDKVKDYIVYHRDSNDGTRKASVFPLGVLHNHVSGIDMTFEKLVDGYPIRFSALIREFWIDKRNKMEGENVDYGEENIKVCTETEPEKRSTYLYEALYSQYSIFDGFSVQWVNGSEDNMKEILNVKTRLNVAEYHVNDKNRLEKIPASKTKGILTRNKKHKQCLRMWSYSINED